MSIDKPRRNDMMTPIWLIERARLYLGNIDLDPASSQFAQNAINADKWYGPFSPYGENGLDMLWAGKVFLNPPGGKVGNKSSAAIWWRKLVRAYLEHEIEAAVFIGFNIEILRTGQNVDYYDESILRYPIIIPEKRIVFDAEINGSRHSLKSPENASIIVLLPKHGRLDMRTNRAFAGFEEKRFAIQLGGIV